MTRCLRDIITNPLQPHEIPSVEDWNLNYEFADGTTMNFFREGLIKGEVLDELVEEALRYDLTVPLSRVIAMYQHEISFPFKRYQIQPVWRADRPQRGRYREFYQCDVDTVGTESMLADAEAIAIVYEIQLTLGFKSFRTRINNRKLLNGILKFANISEDKGNLVFISIDKLDKIGMDGVVAELNKIG